MAQNLLDITRSNKLLDTANKVLNYASLGVILGRIPVTFQSLITTGARTLPAYIKNIARTGNLGKVANKETDRVLKQLGFLDTFERGSETLDALDAGYNFFSGGKFDTMAKNLLASQAFSKIMG